MAEQRSIEVDKKDIPGAEKDAVLRRKGDRRTAGHDTPAGPDTDRTPVPAKREQAEKGRDYPSKS